MTFASEFFDRDIAKHELQVIRDDGVNRHIRFKRPGTMCMHFDLLTWRGYLCYTGDMGTFVFSRLDDMFEFFRRSDTSDRIDFRYWAEKLRAADGHDGAREWCGKKFKAEVLDFFEQHTSDGEDWPAERKDALWQEIDEQVCAAADDSEHHAWVALWEFEHQGFRFQDWERDCKVWSHRFLWCCHALAWAISTYDRAKQAAAGTTAAVVTPT